MKGCKHENSFSGMRETDVSVLNSAFNGMGEGIKIGIRQNIGE